MRCTYRNIIGHLNGKVKEVRFLVFVEARHWFICRKGQTLSQTRHSSHSVWTTPEGRAHARMLYPVCVLSPIYFGYRSVRTLVESKNRTASPHSESHIDFPCIHPIHLRINMDQTPFGPTTDDFVSNPEPRVPCILLLDVSSSMTGQPLLHLSEGLRTGGTV